jgi:glycosyltransferase involved in cell wall biosynthesis
MQTNPNYKITIGLPVYNVEPYIEKCIDSIINQRMDGIEILIVDDCSTDNSIRVVERIIETRTTEMNIELIHHHINKGVGEARNTIIRHAKGKYLYFLDPDDYIEPGSLLLLYKYAEEYKAEVTYGSIAAWKDGQLKTFKQYPPMQFNGKNSFASYVYGSIYETVFTSSINILFLTSFIKENNFVFPNAKLGEDYLFRESFIPKVSTAILRPEITYYYYMRPNSLMQYQYREHIDVKEADFKLWFCKKLKETCKGCEKEDFYDGKCTQVMKSIFYDICGILKHMDQFTSNIPVFKLKEAIKHPAPLFAILKFKKFKAYNLFLYLLGILPMKISIGIIRIIGKKKGWI